MALRIGILGYGKMGGAIAQGLQAAKFDCELRAYDRAAVIPPGIRACSNEEELLSAVDVLLLCIKPQDFPAALSSISAGYMKMKNPPVIASIAAGITISTIESFLGNSAKIARVMPNLAATVSESASCISVNGGMREKGRELVERIFGCVGKTFFVNEVQMDAVTAISGSGPAYFFLLAEALSEAGGKAGLGADLSRKLAIQALIGSGELLKKTGDAPAEIRKKITSPNGTTEAAMAEFERGGFSELVGKAVSAAKKRAEELASNA